MKTPHKHAEVIKAWADGFIVQYFNTMEGKWISGPNDPYFNPEMEWRIKPEPKPDVVRYSYINENGTSNTHNVLHHEWKHNIKHVYDWETGGLKAVEVLK